MTVTFAPLSPAFPLPPTNLIVVAGSSLSLSNQAVGRIPIAYQWQKNAQNIAEATTQVLTLNNLQLADSGAYSLTASNAYGTTNCTLATLEVRNILISINGQPVTNSSFSAMETSIEVESMFNNGAIFYTTDGSVPDFNSAEYTAQFNLNTNCILRVTAYSADFSHSVTSGPLTINIIPSHTIIDSTSWGGEVTIDPPVAPYITNSIVTVWATPWPGWTFMGWSGATNTMSLTNSFVMDGDKHILATFGTTLGATTAGNGTLQIQPNAPLYPYDSAVVFTAIPNPGNYFVRWGNAAYGTENPLTFFVDSSTQSVSALFASLPNNLAALTVIPGGAGTVDTNPGTNRFVIGSTATLTAYPNPGQRFLNWSGAINGTANPISVLMNTSKVVTAHFSKVSALSIDSAKSSVSLQLIGPPGVYNIETSTNLSNWSPTFSVTNFFDTLLFIDPSLAAPPYRMYRAVGQ